MLGQLIVGIAIPVSIFELIQMHALPNRIVVGGQVQLINQSSVLDTASTRERRFQVCVVFFVKVVDERCPKIKLFEFERITGLELKPNVTVVRKLVSTANVKLIIKSLVVVVPHEERVQDGVDSKISLLVWPEFLIDMRQNIFPNHVPQDGFQFHSFAGWRKTVYLCSIFLGSFSCLDNAAVD